MKISKLMVKQEELALPKRTRVTYPIVAGVLILIAIGINVAAWIDTWPAINTVNATGLVLAGIAGILLLVASAWLLMATASAGQQRRLLTRIAEKPEVVVLPVTRQTMLLHDDEVRGRVFTVRMDVPDDRAWEFNVEFRAGAEEPWFVDPNRPTAIVGIRRPDLALRVVPLSANGSPFLLTPAQKQAIQEAADMLNQRREAA